MEYSPSKRRKTSPGTAIQVTASNTNNGIVRNGSRHSAQRSSYMSPTKASLARFNPSLLQRSGSAEPHRAASQQRTSRRARTEDRALEIAQEDLSKPRTSGKSRPENKTNGSLNHTDELVALNLNATPSKLPGTIGADGTKRMQELSIAMETPTARHGKNVDRAKEWNDDDEPSLPSTPSQLGLEAPLEKPRGLLFHSPSRRSSRRDRAQIKSSPLKEHASAERVLLLLGPRVPLKNAPKYAADMPPTETGDHGQSLNLLRTRLKLLQDELTSGTFLSGCLTPDSTGRKKLAKQRRAVAQDAREIKRLRNLRSRDDEGLDGIESPLNHVSRSGTESINRRLIQCLPFSRPRLLAAGVSRNNSTRDETHEEVSLAIKILSSEVNLSASSDIIIEQRVVVSSPNKQKIAEIALSIEPISQTIAQMPDTQLVSWAEKELLPWFSNVTSEKTLMNTSTAIISYVKIATMRKACWSRCKMDFVQLLGATSISEPQASDFGLRSIQFSASSVKLKVDWHVSVNSAGEAESDIALKPTFPPYWHHLDIRHDLAHVEKAFAELFQAKGITYAINDLVAILFPP
ncbi:uncharacterized protein KY384_005429 [Bacidia gigantensis]|uniref:uncharacterized protein n=1 Tax=Bacidia gigantensis TaxID=2732470 RepID=UPI001D05441F|nr:uncharacterized protein KY384_005429 [Bacidia gigantensis]KAG8529948.1 hypothetical protein KY384_005429 [Bacidia gigantensis]